MEGLVELCLTSPQLKLIESVTAIPKGLQESVKHAAEHAKGSRIHIPYDDLDQLAGYLAAEANYEEKHSRKRLLERLYDEVQTALWDFDDRRIAASPLSTVAPPESVTHARGTKPPNR